MGSGGSSANYIFMMGYTGNNGVADETSFDKLTASFALNMKLIDQLGMSCLINASRLSRNETGIFAIVMRRLNICRI